MGKREGNSSSDPLGYMLLLAAFLHIAFILNIGFTPETQEQGAATHRSLKVVVTRPQQTPAEEHASEAQEPPPPTPEAQPEEMVEVLPPPKPAPEPTPAPVPEPPPPAKSAEAPKLTAQVAKEKVAERPKTPAKDKKPRNKPKPKAKPRPKKRITAAQLLASRSDEIARLNQELERKTIAYANRPRRKAVSAATTGYKYATYLEAWRRKVERIGNLNYPDEARRKKLYGNLVLHVAVRADGSIAKIRVLHSSGQKVLDEAAIRIVRLSAPFAPFPKDIRAEADILDITRTWQFLSSNRLGWEK